MHFLFALTITLFANFIIKQVLLLNKTLIMLTINYYMTIKFIVLIPYAITTNSNVKFYSMNQSIA